MVLLHSAESELSRNLLANIPKGVSVLDCSQGPPEGYPYISAYPSVGVDVPPYMADVPALDADGGLLGMKRQPVPSHQEILRMPTSWAAVDEYMAFAAARAVANPVASPEE